MLMVVTNDGKKNFLDLATISGGDVEDWEVWLFKNNYTPVDGSVTANFTPADFPGFAEVIIPQGVWGPSVIVADVAESDSHNTPTFTCTGGGGQLVYGWFMKGNTTGKTYLAQRFDTPRNMVAGATEVLDPFKLKLKIFA